MKSEIKAVESQDIFNELNAKFTNNLKISLNDEKENLNRIELKARKLPVIGQIIREKVEISSTQAELLVIFDEVFSDIITSIYFASCSLDKPAQIILRRALELGIAVVYMWDLPYVFWGWKNHDKDLNFNEMIEYLTDDSFRTYIEKINCNYKGQNIFNHSETRNLYRKLSNTTHGKISTFESNLPLRFSHNVNDWHYHLELVEKVEDIIMELWEKRFFDCLQELEKRTPSTQIMKRGK